ncbi:MAG: DUF3995 domain-containing protein, partial [Thermomicrobiales bacterium]
MSRKGSNAPSNDATPGTSRGWLKRFGQAAFLWSLAFGLLSAYWALGGMVGADQLSPALREQAERRETGFVAILWVTAGVRLVGGFVPLALAFELWLTMPRRFVSILTWLGGVLLTLYGIGDIVSGTIRASVGNDDGAIWYATLWGPIWLAGGLLYLGTAWLHRRQTVDPA